MPHLVVALSSHGFGHIGQTAPVIERLVKQVPGLRVTLRTASPHFKLIERFGAGVDIVPVQTDVGMIQQDAQSIAREASAQAYLQFHREWELRVEEEARALSQLRADALLSNVPYLSLAGAQRAGIPALALCSINWLDIYTHYFGGRPEAPTLLEQMRKAYESALVFLQPTPSMPMPQLNNRRAIGPICQRGHTRREWFVDRLGLRPNERLVMVSLGGMELRPSVEQWPSLPGVRLLVPVTWRSPHQYTVDFEPLGVSYVDALASCDALVCKPGYGSFVEAACAGVPVLYLSRPGWPEAPYLVRWLEAVGRCALLTQEHWFAGNLLAGLDRLWYEGLPSSIAPSGVEEAANMVAEILV